MIPILQIIRLTCLHLLLIGVLISCGSTESNLSVLSVQEQKIIFGKELFFDKQLSSNGKVSCASCHIPKYYFTNRKQKGIGVNGKTSLRNVPSLYNVVDLPYFMYDGGPKTLEMQVLIPLQDSAEMNMHVGTLLNRLKKNKKYQLKSQKLYKRSFDAYVLTRSLSNYQKSLVSKNSKFDQFKRNEVKFTKSEIEGFELFQSLKCVSCHSGKNLTNSRFKDNGLTVKNENDLGRFRVSQKSFDKWKFKVPSLRNVEMTSPYMHNGSIRTLEEVINLYEKSEIKSVRIRKLSSVEKFELISFLKTLTDRSVNQ